MAAETEDDSDADDECVLTDAKDENVDLEKAKGCLHSLVVFRTQFKVF